MRILIFTEAILPPAYLPRVMYFCSYFVEKGWDVDLVVETTEHLQYVPEKVTLLSIDYYKNKKRFLNKIEWVVKFLLDVFCDYKGRYFFRNSKELFCEKQYDLVFCSSCFTFPLTTAQRVAKKLQIPLFVDLRDIAEQSPDDTYYISHKPPKLLGLGDLITKIYIDVSVNRRNKILRKATGVTSVSPWHVKLLSQYNENTHLIYNGFNENIFLPKKLKTDKFTISHFGRIYNKQMRNPEILLIALTELLKKGVISIENTVVRWFVDEPSKKVVREIAESYSLSDLMEFYDFIPPEMLPDEMNKSSILLILCNIKGIKNLFGMMTTKFFEALGVNRPIVCTPDNQDHLSELVQTIQCGLVSSDALEIEKFLHEKFNEWQDNGRTKAMLKDELRMGFSRRNGAEKLEKILLNAIKN